MAVQAERLGDHRLLAFEGVRGRRGVTEQDGGLVEVLDGVVDLATAPLGHPVDV